MPNNAARHGQGRAATTARRPTTNEGYVNIGPALVRSVMTRLFGRPYPVQFRAQGALDAWAHALGGTSVWPHWQHPSTLCWQIRQEILQQLEGMYPLSSIDTESDADENLRLAFQASTNLKYHLSGGTVIEATEALETLLANSDVDISLPMSMVAPPYRAQYLRFGETAMRYLNVPDPQSSDHRFDGAFCFLTQHGESDDPVGKCWTLELISISKRQDRYGGHVSLLGETDRGDITVGEWLDEVLSGVAATDQSEIHRTMHTAVSYVVRVFLYMALKQARVIAHREYDEALRRSAGLGERKRAKLLRKSASLYNGIVVGPESLSPSASESVAGSGVAPHWRRGHFRMQPFGAGNQQRKLIFVAPTLVHADQVQNDAPVPKTYRAGAAAVTGA